MRAVIQRVLNAKVIVDNEIIGKIDKGLLILLGVGNDDCDKDAEYLSEKIIGLRVFEDNDQKMNLSLKDVNGECLIVSQFTIYGDCRRGKRPSFDKAANLEVAEKLYNRFIEKCIEKGIKVETGKFRAKMNIELVNSGPVTFILDSKE